MCAAEADVSDVQVQYMNIPLQDKLFEVPLDDHVLYGTHGDLQKIGIGRVCEMPIDLFFRIPVQRAKLVHEVLAGLLSIVWGTMIISEAVVRYRAPRQLLLEKVDLVEEQNQGRLGEPVRVGDRLPEHQGLVHLVLCTG